MSLAKNLECAVAKILIACDTCAGVVFPIVDWDEQQRVEQTLQPIERTRITVELPLGDINGETVCSSIQLIWSLRFPINEWMQRRQYLEIINCSVVDYEIVGRETGELMSIATTGVLYKLLNSFDKTIQSIQHARPVCSIGPSPNQPHLPHTSTA